MKSPIFAAAALLLSTALSAPASPPLPDLPDNPTASSFALTNIPWNVYSNMRSIYRDDGYYPTHMSIYVSDDVPDSQRPVPYYSAVWSKYANETALNGMAQGMDGTPEKFKLEVTCNRKLGKAPQMLMGTTGYVLDSFTREYVAEENIVSLWHEQTPEEKGWEVEYSVNKTTFVDRFEKYVEYGYRLKSIHGYEFGGQSKFTGLWVPNRDGRAWQARIEMTAAGYQKVFDEMKADGFKPVVVEGYTVKGVTYYAALFEKAPKGFSWVARHGYSTAKFEAEREKWEGKGYVPTVVSSYLDKNGKTPLWAGLWEKK